MARPRKLTQEQVDEVVVAFEKYVDIYPDPTIVGFTASDKVALKYRVNKDNITDWAEFSELRRRAIEKQEHYLLYGATRGQLNASVSIFRLKQPQHGFSDRQEIDHTTKGEPIQPLIVSNVTPINAPTEGETEPRSPADQKPIS